MEGKSVSETSVILSHVMLPQDANPAGNIHGGRYKNWVGKTSMEIGVRAKMEDALPTF